MRRLAVCARSLIFGWLAAWRDATQSPRRKLLHAAWDWAGAQAAAPARHASPPGRRRRRLAISPIAHSLIFHLQMTPPPRVLPPIPTRTPILPLAPPPRRAPRASCWALLILNPRTSGAWCAPPRIRRTTSCAPRAATSRWALIVGLWLGEGFPLGFLLEAKEPAAGHASCGAVCLRVRGAAAAVAAQRRCELAPRRCELARCGRAAGGSRGVEPRRSLARAVLGGGRSRQQQLETQRRGIGGSQA